MIDATDEGATAYSFENSTVNAYLNERDDDDGIAYGQRYMQCVCELRTNQSMPMRQNTNMTGIAQTVLRMKSAATKNHDSPHISLSIEAPCWKWAAWGQTRPVY